MANCERSCDRNEHPTIEDMIPESDLSPTAQQVAAQEQGASCAHLRVLARKVDRGEIMVQPTTEAPGGLRHLVYEVWECESCHYQFLPFGIAAQQVKEATTQPCVLHAEHLKWSTLMAFCEVCIKEQVAQAVREERERCARVALTYQASPLGHPLYAHDLPTQIAEAIRTEPAHDG